MGAQMSDPRELFLHRVWIRCRELAPVVHGARRTGIDTFQTTATQRVIHGIVLEIMCNRVVGTRFLATIAARTQLRIDEVLPDSLHYCRHLKPSLSLRTTFI